MDWTSPVQPGWVNLHNLWPEHIHAIILGMWALQELLIGESVEEFIRKLGVPSTWERLRDAGELRSREGYKEIKPWARLVGLRPPHRPQANRQNRNLDSPPITILILIPGVPVLLRPPYRFYPGVYSSSPTASACTSTHPPKKSSGCKEYKSISSIM